MKAILISALCLLNYCFARDNLLCSSSTCKMYVGDHPCTPIPDNCKIQNATHNGIFLPAPVICNCCDYCLENLDEGDYCAIGDPSSPTPTSICGDLLTCTAGNESTCQRMSTICTYYQNIYDEKRADGTLGRMELRPNCDGDGNYEPYKCIPGEICYCLNKDGERIFGEIPFSSSAPLTLRCGCSRDYDTITDSIGYELGPDNRMRCLANGDYDPLQCISGNCICVNYQDGSPAFLNMNPVNVTLISKDTIRCFDSELHRENDYYNNCEQRYLEKVEEVEDLKQMGNFEIIGTTFPNCQLDGKYAPIQRNETHKYCVDPDSNILEDFVLPLEDGLAGWMNCKCARAREMLKNHQEKPVCCGNGNYQNLQCRRGMCYCVDHDGNQVGQEKPYEDKMKLICFGKECTMRIPK